MRKLLNTLYVTKADTYLALDGENIVCRLDDAPDFRISFENVESIVCFSYQGCSPALMGKCAEKLIPISFLSPQGRFLAKVTGETKGTVHLRVAQIDRFRQDGFVLAQNVVAAKLSNAIHLIARSQHDRPELRSEAAVRETVAALRQSVDAVYLADTMDSLRGIEANAAKSFLSVFDRLMKTDTFSFTMRSKRPPTDPVNAMLSFVYTLYTLECASALETVGLDSGIGYFHTLRSGRASLACDLVEEFRAIAERFILTLINLKMVNQKDFTTLASGAVYLNDEGRKKLLTHWQEKKRTDILHPVLKQKIQFGLLPYVQSNLLAKYVRGEIAEYPCYLVK